MLEEFGRPCALGELSYAMFYGAGAGPVSRGGSQMVCFWVFAPSWGSRWRVRMHVHMRLCRDRSRFSLSLSVVVVRRCIALLLFVFCCCFLSATHHPLAL